MKKLEPDSVEEGRALLKALSDLEANPVWMGEILPWLLEMRDLETKLHEDVTLTPGQRAEHLWAMKRLREAAGLTEAFRERMKTRMRREG